MPVTFNEDPEDLFIFYNNIDKERIKKHFCSSGSSGIYEDTQHQTKSRLKEFGLGLQCSSDWLVNCAVSRNLEKYSFFFGKDLCITNSTNITKSTKHKNTVSVWIRLMRNSSFKL